LGGKVGVVSGTGRPEELEASFWKSKGYEQRRTGILQINLFRDFFMSSPSSGD